jgi:hypothetical protein
MPSQDIYFRANRRLHRIFGTYLALRAWVEGSDGVVVDRDSLLAALDLKKLQLSRIEQFCDDNKSLFPHKELRKVSPGAKIVALVLARRPLPTAWSRADRASVVAANLTKAGLVTAEVELPPEQDVVRLLALLGHGLPANVKRRRA